MPLIKSKIGLRMMRQLKIGSRKISSPSGRKMLFKSYHKMTEGKVHLEAIHMKNNHTDITVRIPFGDMGVRDAVAETKKFFPLDKVSKLPWDKVHQVESAIHNIENKV